MNNIQICTYVDSSVIIRQGLLVGDHVTCLICNTSAGFMRIYLEVHTDITDVRIFQINFFI